VGSSTGQGKTKDHKIGIDCFLGKEATLRSKSKDWLGSNQDNVSKWSGVERHVLPVDY